MLCESKQGLGEQLQRKEMHRLLHSSRQEMMTAPTRMAVVGVVKNRVPLFFSFKEEQLILWEAGVRSRVVKDSS